MLLAGAFAFAGLAGIVLSLMQSWPVKGFGLYHGGLDLGAADPGLHDRRHLVLLAAARAALSGRWTTNPIDGGMTETALHFDQSLAAVYGVAERLSPRIERLLAPNPSPFTFRGTGVYLVGDEKNVVGDRSRSQRARACRGAAGRRSAPAP